jgi:hypothetical protein
MLRRSFATALVVGTLLVAINQGDLLAHGQWLPALLWKIPLTYVVPFAVATWGALANSRITLPRSFPALADSQECRPDP